ncbi:hypothetical protein GCM10022276_22290 [Sphingomonas limnosediminicola]|uniref:Uncharacterized protein n=1 Tax=Sphingomonas limnosediminicola TaxID=940133 RepID=A0ABP7LLC5_9SPHN
MRNSLMVVGLIGVSFAAAAEARPIPNTGTPQTIQQLIACRAIADSAQRLACFDRQTDVLNQAIAKKEVVVIDKQRATAAKRSLFGFSIPDFGGLFGGGGDEIKEIASTVTRVQKDPYGALIVTLADGSTWAQQDDSQLGLPPEKGDKVVVHRGSFGAFFLRVGSQPGIRVKRVG